MLLSVYLWILYNYVEIMFVINILNKYLTLHEMLAYNERKCTILSECKSLFNEFLFVKKNPVSCLFLDFIQLFADEDYL